MFGYVDYIGGCKTNYPVQFSSPYDEFKSFIAQKFHEGVVEKIFIIRLTLPIFLWSSIIESSWLYCLHWGPRVRGLGSSRL